MRWLDKLRLTYQSIFRRGRVDQELDTELQFFLDQETEKHIAAGLTPRDATKAAQRTLGNLTRVKEACRDQRRLGLLDDGVQDVRYGLRALRRNPALTLVVIAMLGLGIGASTAIFSVMNATLLRPLPYANAHELVTLWHSYPLLGGGKFSVSVPGYLDYIELNRTFAAIAATRNRSVNLSGGGDPVRLIGLGVTANFFETIGVSPQVGRTFVAQEDQPNADTVAVLSHGLWERQFAADPAVVGQRVLLDGRAHDVIGVLPASFVFPGEIDIYLPAAFTPQERENRGGEFLSVVARLRSDVSLSEAQSDMARISRLLQPQFYAFDDRWHLIVEPFQDTLVEEVRPAVLVLMVAVGLILLVGCLNVANLLVARGWARRTELAVRAALGAGRSRVVRQLVTESLVLALLAGVVGCAIAAGMVPVLVSALPDGMCFQQVVVDGRVLGFALFVSVVTGLLFGTLPALHAAQLEPQNILRGGRGASTRTGRTRTVLVTAEIAVAVVLIVGTGLLARSFLMLQRVEPGFRVAQVLTMRVALPANRYPEPTQQTALYRRILDGLRSVPAITEAGAISVLPLSQQTLNSSFAIEGIPILEDEAAPHGDPRAATPGYFAAMGIDVLRGQLYGNVDEATPPVVVIDEEMVRRYFLDDDPIGRRIAFFFEGSPDVPHWREIVGVVRNVKHDGLDRDPRMQIYYPYRQRPQGAMFLAVRTVGDPTAVQALVREVVRREDAQLPLYDVRTMNERLAASLGPRRYTASVMVAFGLTALLMAGIGTYGVMAYLVSTTTRELGIRIALGAKRSQVAGLVLGRGLALTGAGVMLGVVSALALSRLLSSVLFGIASTDPLTFGAAVVVVFSVATVACWLRPEWIRWPHCARSKRPFFPVLVAVRWDPALSPTLSQLANHQKRKGAEQKWVAVCTNDWGATTRSWRLTGLRSSEGRRPLPCAAIDPDSAPGPSRLAFRTGRGPKALRIAQAAKKDKRSAVPLVAHRTANRVTAAASIYSRQLREST